MKNFLRLNDAKFERKWRFFVDTQMKKRKRVEKKNKMKKEKKKEKKEMTKEDVELDKADVEKMSYSQIETDRFEVRRREEVNETFIMDICDVGSFAFNDEDDVQISETTIAFPGDNNDDEHDNSTGVGSVY